MLIHEEISLDLSFLSDVQFMENTIVYFLEMVGNVKPGDNEVTSLQNSRKQIQFLIMYLNFSNLLFSSGRWV
ncbi:unnamed protein product [Heterobilharzia americana]|nr:unnamed protein product [Heterobilharzia americana]